MPRQSLETVVLAAIAESHPVHVLDVADRLGESPVSVDLACARLRDRGEVALAGRGTYRLTERGRRRRADDEKVSHGASSP